MSRLFLVSISLLLVANRATCEEVQELPKSLRGHYTVWASIAKDGKVSSKSDRKESPLFFVGPRHAITIGVGTIFERIEKHEIGGRTFYICHPHLATGVSTPDILIEDLGGGVLLFSEKGEHLMCKRSERTLDLKGSEPKRELAGKPAVSKSSAVGVQAKATSQAR